jgi:hypothetical protein
MRNKPDRPSPPLGCEEIHTFLLGAGALALGAAAIFFIAANWEALGRLGRFVLLEGGLFLSVLGALRFPPPSRAASALLLAASLLTGALLALTGQTYQLGADRWELFAWWAGLILPWVLIARSQLLWGLWALIFQTALWLYSIGSNSFIPLLHPDASYRFGDPELALLVDLAFLLLFEAAVGGGRRSVSTRRGSWSPPEARPRRSGRCWGGIRFPKRFSSPCSGSSPWAGSTAWFIGSFRSWPSEPWAYS